MNEAPVITKKPDSIQATDGDSVSFKCRAEGKPLPKIMWLSNNQPIEEDDDITIQTIPDVDKNHVESVLSIKKVLLDDESDQYKVQAVSSIGQDEAPFVLIGEFHTELFLMMDEVHFHVAEIVWLKQHIQLKYC